MKDRLRIPSQKSLRRVGILVAVVIVAIGGYVFTQNATAATAVLLPDSDVTTGWAQCNAGTCGSARYTYIDEDIASPTDSDYIGTGSAGASAANAAVEFGLTTTANVDTVSSIQVGVRARIQTVGGSTADTISINLRIGGNLQTATTVTPSTTAYGNHTATFNGTWTQAQLDGAQVLVTRNTLGSGNPTNQRDDVRISAISATATYTLNQQLEQGNYRFYENADSNSPGTALAAQDTAVEVPIGQPFRLRQLLEVGISPLSAGSNFKLQFGEKVSACSTASYSLVGEFVASNNPTVVANSLYAGSGNAWSSPSNAATSNDSRASLITAGVSQYLWADDFGFSVPTTATITGIEVRYEGRVGDDLLVYDTTTELVKNGSVVGTSNINNGFGEVDSVISLGGSSDLWGSSWTPTDINDPDFGVAIHAELDSGETIDIDAVELYVYYQDSTKDVQLMNNPSVALQATAGTASNPAPSTGSITEQQYSELAYLSTNSSVSAGDHALWDFPLVSTSAALGNTYCFRIVNGDDSPLDAYNHYAEVTFVPAELSQANYRFYENADSASPGAALAAQDTPATIAAETPFRLRQLLGVDTGTLAQGTNFELEYGEKVTTCSVASYSPMTSNTSVTEFPASVVNDNSTGDTPWSNPGNATATDASYASVNGLGFGSNYLWATDFGFSVPTGATINGITVWLRGYVDSLTSANGTMSILKNGTIVDTENFIVDTEETTNSVGSSIYLWNNSWTASDINDTDFGVAFDISGYDTLVNSMQITVYYTALAGDVLSYDNTSVATTATLGSASNPAPASGSVVNQQYTESSVFSAATATNAGDSALWDFALTSSSAADGKTYCFRVVDDNGDPLDGGYDYYPEITFGSGGGGGPTLDQMTRGGGGVIDGVKQNYSW